LDKFDVEKLIEKAIEHIDMESIISDVMDKLVLKDVDLYFVVYQQLRCMYLFQQHLSQDPQL